MGDHQVSLPLSALQRIVRQIRESGEPADSHFTPLPGGRCAYADGLVMSDTDRRAVIIAAMLPQEESAKRAEPVNAVAKREKLMRRMREAEDRG